MSILMMWHTHPINMHGQYIGISYLVRVFKHLRAKKTIDIRQKTLMTHHDAIVECKATFDADGKLAPETLAH